MHSKYSIGLVDQIPNCTNTRFSTACVRSESDENGTEVYRARLKLTITQSDENGAEEYRARLKLTITQSDARQWHHGLPFPIATDHTSCSHVTAIKTSCLLSNAVGSCSWHCYLVDGSQNRTLNINFLMLPTRLGPHTHTHRTPPHTHTHAPVSYTHLTLPTRRGV